MYKEIPFVEKAIIIRIGIIKIKLWSFSIKIFSMAGSSKYAIPEVLPATKNEKTTAMTIFFKCFEV